MGNAQTRLEPDLDYSGKGMKVPSLIHGGSLVDLRHFELMRCVGKGAFGKVRIVIRRDTRKQMALKYINKQQCVRMSAVANIFREKAILIEVQHPFVVNLRYAFQDEENMFMVIDLMLGGDLRYQLDKNQALTEETVKFIIAECACAIAYLHSHEIIHRDLKPENILLDEYGHAHLTDFNIAVHYLQNKPLTSRSGTHSYMGMPKSFPSLPNRKAPEVFGKVGYMWQVDWWSLGIVFYEILFGKRPFRGANQEETAAAICDAELIIPDINLYTQEPLIVDVQCGDIISRMLERDVPSRICCGKSGFEEFKAHPYYEGLDWVLLERKGIQPPFVPESNKDNFDISHDLEELLLDDNPLRYKKEAEAEGDSDESGGPVPQVERLNRSESGEKEPVAAAPEDKNDEEIRHHPLDYDPYLQALQRNESPTETGKQVTPTERIDLELAYIKSQFKDYNWERDGNLKPVVSQDDIVAMAKIDTELARATTPGGSSQPSASSSKSASSSTKSKGRKNSSRNSPEYGRRKSSNIFKGLRSGGPAKIRSKANITSGSEGSTIDFHSASSR